MRKQIKHILLILLLTFSLSACAKKSGNNEVGNNQVDIDSAKNQHSKVGLEILDTNVDISNWIEYKSDKFGYSFRLPPEYVFLSEGASNLIVKYDMNKESFEVGTVEKGNNINYLLSIYIIKKDIDSFISAVESETGKKDQVVKMFSKDGVDYYYKEGGSNMGLIPSIVYKNSVIVGFSYNNDKNQEIYKTIINSVRFFE